ncbi:hypothetical protein F4X88_19610 [Candidatus Poribacteria bacterium]|nr:hypothetical protein [Candidatus Poribacteria bacterium]MYA58490.1 hypothetical protein [Candidatus Poribacteria bacterium]
MTSADGGSTTGGSTTGGVVSTGGSTTGGVVSTGGSTTGGSTTGGSTTGGSTPTFNNPASSSIASTSASKDCTCGSLSIALSASSVFSNSMNFGSVSGAKFNSRSGAATTVPMSAGFPLKIPWIWSDFSPSRTSGKTA